MASTKTYHFLDNWVGNLYEFSTLRKAKKEAQKRTYGFCIYIYCDGKTVAKIEPKDQPLP